MSANSISRLIHESAALRESGRARCATEAIDEAYRLFLCSLPKADPGVAFLLANELSETSQVALADEVFEHLYIDPYDCLSSVYHLQAEHLMRHGHFREAAAVLEKISDTEVNYPHAQAHLSIVLLELGKADEASLARQRALRCATEDQKLMVSGILKGEVLNGMKASLARFKKDLA